jgi:hypothetical protein
MPTRNPEELLEVLTLLTWAAGALAEAEPAGPARRCPTAIDPHCAGVCGPCAMPMAGWRGFTAADKGAEGRLDQALAASGAGAAMSPGMAMGFARLAGGRTSVILDAADPPGGGRADGACLDRGVRADLGAAAR